MRLRATPAMLEQLWLRFATGQPVSPLTLQFVSWCCQRLAALGRRVLLLVSNDPLWHTIPLVRTWRRAHRNHVKETGPGVRIVAYRLTSKSPWINPMEPKWVHGTRPIVGPVHVLTAQAVVSGSVPIMAVRMKAHLSISEKTA